MKKFYDIVFVGGGLANALSAYRLRQIRPDIEFLILDPGDRFGGNRTWFFHDADVSQIDFSWIQPFISRSWSGTDVKLPSCRRTLGGGYHAVRSDRLHETLKAAFHYQIGLKHRAVDIFENLVVLDDGFKVHAGCVVDGRGWQPPGHSNLGFRKYFGLELALKAPHGLERPLLVDATSPQDDGLRFVSVFPWTDTTVLIEDARYSERPEFDETVYRREILAYVARQGWDIGDTVRAEFGTRPLPLDGTAPSGDEGLVLSGGRAGLYHAATGAGFPAAVRFAEALSSLPDFNGAVVSRWARDYRERHWRSQAFFRLVNRLLFRAVPPDGRFKLLHSFYQRPEALISRFYAGRLTPVDRLRLLSRPSPVPIRHALRELLSPGGRA